ncbi:hypothetical protein C8R44DRAFT_790783 [Mycena epipterygia]|nr:hypothetical protein C8R44DRAFT_790783 [Mycena epipterygia]
MDSLSHILETNDAPTELEISVIQDLISDCHSRKAHLNTTSAPGVEEVVADIDEQLLKYKAALSPLRRMPTELLSLIFTFALLLPCDTLEADPPLWTLGQVSSRWRTVLLSQPRFWAKVDLDFALYPDETKFRLKTQLRRSGDSPLDIDFLCDDASRLTGREIEFGRMLAAKSQRWERVSLYGQYTLYDELQRIRDRLPLLQELHIMMRAFPNYSLDIFESAPNLRHAFINMGYFTSPITVRLPFSQLLRYGGSNTWQGHLDALPSACNLVDCSLEICSTPTAPPASRILLPQLRHLALTSSKFLDCLETPLLEELHCSGPPSHLISFLHRLRSPLRKLFVHECNSILCPAFDIAPVLHAAPAVSDIGIHSRGSTAALISVLTIRHESTDVLAPALQSITLDIKSDYTVDVGLRLVETSPTSHMMDMLESRWRAGNLRSVHIRCSAQFFASKSRQRIERLQAQGLNIELHYSDTPLLLDMTPSHLRLFYAQQLI